MKLFDCLNAWLWGGLCGHSKYSFWISNNNKWKMGGEQANGFGTNWCYMEWLCFFACWIQWKYSKFNINWRQIHQLIARPHKYTYVSAGWAPGACVCVVGGQTECRSTSSQCSWDVSRERDFLPNNKRIETTRFAPRKPKHTTHSLTTLFLAWK